MLLLSALAGENRKRKVDMLARSWLPGLKFLSGYYNRGKALSTLDRLRCLLLHWIVMILPAGVVRRTFGPQIWRVHYDPRLLTVEVNGYERQRFEQHIRISK